MPSDRRMVDLHAHARRLAQHFRVLKPEGPGPFPVCLQLHGCGGLFPMQQAYAEAARGAGVAAVIVDSYGPRGIGGLQARATICTGARLRGAERSIDLLAAIEWLKLQAWADQGRIAAAGWSHGAWAIMEALAGTRAEARVRPPPLKAAILFYPYCGPLARTAAHGWGENRPRVYACIGGRDVVVGRWRIEQALHRLRRDGLSVRSLMLEDADHGFDEADAGAWRGRFRPDLADAARAFYVEALTESLVADEGAVH